MVSQAEKCVIELKVVEHPDTGATKVGEGAWWDDGWWVLLLEVVEHRDASARETRWVRGPSRLRPPPPHTPAFSTLRLPTLPGCSTILSNRPRGGGVAV